MNYIFNKNEIVYVSAKDSYGKIIDVNVIGANTQYMIVFDDGTWNTFFGYELKGDK